MNSILPTELTQTLSDHADFAGWVVFGSFVVFLGGMLIVPWLVIRMPPDYFIRPRASASYTQWRYPIFRWIVKVAKNIFGVILLILGIAMLVLPGQGLLTMAAGILLMDFPGKRRFERWLVRRPAILRSANWMRRRAGRIPLQVR